MSKYKVTIAENMTHRQFVGFVEAESKKSNGKSKKRIYTGKTGIFCLFQNNNVSQNTNI